MRDGDFNIKNGWLEDNLNIWIDLFRLKPKAPMCSMNMYFQQKAKEQAEKAQNTIFSDDNGIEILK